MKRESAGASVLPSIARNIEEIRQVEREHFRLRSVMDCLGDAISHVVGGIGFVVAQALLLGIWLALNTGLVPGTVPFDPYPFSLLALLVSAEGVFLATFVLMSQNRQRRQADHRSHLHLQIGLLTEQEATKILQMLHRIHEHLGLDRSSQDNELNDMEAKTPVGAVAQELAEQPGK